MTDESHDNQGEAVPLNWACTNCGYHVEGELPEKCPECGEDRRCSRKCQYRDTSSKSETPR
jgi:rubrerythrin